MIEDISINEAIQLLDLYEGDASFEERYILSRDVRKKIESDKIHIPWGSESNKNS